MQRRLLATLSLLPFAAAALAQAPDAPPAPAPTPTVKAPVPPAAMQTIARDELLAHATWLASDERGGRLTGSPGQLAAANYIAEHFAKLGLEPLGDEVEGKRGWLQHYGVKRTTVKDGSELQIGGVKLRDGFAVLGGRELEANLLGKARFCGVGRTRGERADLPEGAMLDGAVAVVLVKQPRGKVDRPLGIEQKFGMAMQTLGQFGAIGKALTARGAGAIVFVPLHDHLGLSDVLNYLAVSPGKDVLAPRFDGAEDAMGGFGRLAGGNGAPSLVLSVAAGAKVLGELGLSVEAAEQILAGEGEPPAAKDDVPAALTLSVTSDATATACNVVAVLRGSDPALAGEAVVYSAHMDHVGKRLDGEIYNGADDNASGSAGLLAIAGAFARGEAKPKRSVIFLSVSGEELGLWGSAYFADHPTWDGKLIANVNTDMIGRSGPESGADEVTVTPSHKHRMFSTVVQDAARFGEVLGMKFTSGDKYYERSDHFNFAKKGIPVVFFCNGEHEDYHQVTDHADKLDGAKMERIARLAFWTGWSVANADDAPRKLGRRETW